MSEQTKWTIKFIPDVKYPDIGEYLIMEPNSDAGKSGVPYSGKELVATRTDSKENAARIVQAVNNYEELKEALQKTFSLMMGESLTQESIDYLGQVANLLRRIEEEK